MKKKQAQAADAFEPGQLWHNDTNVALVLEFDHHTGIVTYQWYPGSGDGHHDDADRSSPSDWRSNGWQLSKARKQKQR